MNQAIPLGPRRPWVGFLAVMIVLAGLELAAGGLVSHALLPHGLALVVDGLLLILTVAMIVVVASPLAARVTVGPTHARVRFGLVGGATIDRADVVGAALYVPPALAPVQLGADVRDDGIAAMSLGGSGPYVRVDLARPVDVRYAVARHWQASAVVVATTRAQDLVAALGRGAGGTAAARSTSASLQPGWVGDS